MLIGARGIKMPNKIKIAIDAMGGDNAPSEIVKGAVAALESHDINLALLGAEDQISTELSKLSYPKERVEIVNCTEVIGVDESPAVAIKQKKDSSLVVGFNLLKKGEADALVSAGSTGALLAGATLIVGRIPGIERPALATLLPTEKGFTFMLDSGANVDCKPSYLLQFARMGSLYMENVLGIKSPKVGLVNIGSEKEKGNQMVKEAYVLLEGSGLNFTGNIEARDIPSGVCDVIVCDGFVGNVILKYMEGFAKSMFSMLKKELMSDSISKLGALLSKKAFGRLRASFDYSEVGGAPILGLKALVVKAHGSSDARAIKGAVRQSVMFAENDIVNKIKSSNPAKGEVQGE